MQNAYKKRAVLWMLKLFIGFLFRIAYHKDKHLLVYSDVCAVS